MLHHTQDFERHGTKQEAKIGLLIRLSICLCNELYGSICEEDLAGFFDRSIISNFLTIVWEIQILAVQLYRYQSLVLVQCLPNLFMFFSAKFA